MTSDKLNYDVTDDEDGIEIFAELDGETAGVIMTSADGLRLTLEDIRIDQRRRGIGSELLRRVLSLARGRGFREIVGVITPDDLSEQPWLPDWYQQRGFTVESPAGTAELGERAISMKLVDGRV